MQKNEGGLADRIEAALVGVVDRVAEIPFNLKKEFGLWPLYGLMALDAGLVGYVMQFVGHAQRFANSVGGEIHFDYGQLTPELLIGAALLGVGYLIHINGPVNELVFDEVLR